MSTISGIFVVVRFFRYYILFSQRSFQAQNYTKSRIEIFADTFSHSDSMLWAGSQALRYLLTGL